MIELIEALRPRCGVVDVTTQGTDDPLRCDGRKLDGLGNAFAVAGNKYGWMVEIDPRHPQRPPLLFRERGADHGSERSGPFTAAGIDHRVFRPAGTAELHLFGNNSCWVPLGSSWPSGVPGRTQVMRDPA